jgi:NADPH:quinone reductase-like Zn-dependent oxidoreductase
MKSYHATSGRGLASLVAKEHPIPRPGPHEVLVRMYANSLNARELSILRGTYPLPVKPDVVMCSDGAGQVEAVGADVTRVRVGDRVSAAIRDGSTVQSHGSTRHRLAERLTAC